MLTIKMFMITFVLPMVLLGVMVLFAVNLVRELRAEKQRSTGELAW